MFRKLLMAMALAAMTVSLAPAQRGGGGGRGGGGFGGGFPMAPRATKADDIAKELKLKKEQKPELEAILNEAGKKVLPLSQQIDAARVELVQLSLSGKPADDVVKKLAALDAQMLAVEADALSQIVAKLDDKQKQKVPKAYGIMAGMFKATPIVGRGGR